MTAETTTYEITITSDGECPTLEELISIVNAQDGLSVLSAEIVPEDDGAPPPRTQYTVNPYRLRVYGKRDA